MRSVLKKTLMLGLLGTSFLVFPWQAALWVDAALLLFGFAIGDIIEWIVWSKR